jgi:cold shock CspA family protein
VTNDKRTGTVAAWRSDAGFGFVRVDGGAPDVFLHISRCAFGVPQVGQRLRFRIASTSRGPKAEDVEVVGAGDAIR